VGVRVYEDRLEVFYGGDVQLTIGRMLGGGGHRINYRHVIDSLVRKPGAFARYRYRAEMFPSLAFRRAYDALRDARPTERQADLEYLRILQIASQTMESEVQAALELLLSAGTMPRAVQVRELVDPSAPAVPDLPVLAVDLNGYDMLLGKLEEVA
jgi:hypothetical protein